ncbi:hypothetical protein [Nocardioides sp.]|uniref:hypothetical protein n=1 Tax=Nocardioides sp. TaxID=35761 RepID=UPI0035ADE652
MTIAGGGEPARELAVSLRVRAQLPPDTTPERRLARAALAAARVLRHIDPAPCHVRFRIPSLAGAHRDVVIEAIEDLTDDAVAERLRQHKTMDSVDRAEVRLELVDLTDLEVEEVALAPSRHPVIALGAPVARLSPTASGSLTVAVLDTVKLTLAPGDGTTLETSAALLRSARESISREMHDDQS